MFERVLAMAGYVPIGEMAAWVAIRDETLAALRDMTIARDELARRHASAQEELQALVTEHSSQIRAWEERGVQWEGERGQLFEQLDAANTFIAELQRQRPQMRLVRPESEDRRSDDTAPAEDEVITREHMVEMSARLIIVALEGRTFWTLSVDDHQFKVAVHDHAFLDKGQPITKGTVIRAEFLETVFRRVDGEPYAVRSLERVLEVIPPAPQTTEPMFDAPAASGRS
ncbi:MAG TPA: hypothetical protein VLC46_20390 [Thermoanaerobaculia bacterium]|nr:hypothetical protein [Thermoanaerobaculia bacterium]